MPALNFRSPQQQTISNDVFKNYLNHYGYSGENKHGATLTNPPIGTTRFPFIYKLSAPTGWGKTNVSMEPLRYVTRAISNDDLMTERWIPISLEEYREMVPEQLKNMSDTELLNHMRDQIQLERMYPEDDDGLPVPLAEKTELEKQVQMAMLNYYSQPEGPLPLSIDQGAVAVFVRTRSQTQAFLREARRKQLNSIALPSKASVCMNNKVQRDAAELENLDIEISEADASNASQILTGQWSALDGTNPSEKLTPYNPRVNRFAARLHSHACDSCSKCPLNLGFQTRRKQKLENDPGETLKGAEAESYLIYRSGIMESSAYLEEVVSLQQETMDLEESTGRLWERHPTICPYPVIRNSLAEFDFLILTYPYLFNPEVTAVMSEYLGHVKHALIDEAHNISGLYGQLTTYIYPGYSEANKRMSGHLYDFDVTREMHITPLEKELSKSLFGEKYEKELLAMMDILRRVEGMTNSEYIRKEAVKRLEEDGNFDPTEAIKLYDQLEPRLKQLGVWVALVQHRYMEWYQDLANRFGENEIGKGFEPIPTDILYILFGSKPIHGVLQGEEDEETGDKFYYTNLANSPSMIHMRKVAHDVNAVLRDLLAVQEIVFSDRLTLMRRSNNAHVASIARQAEIASHDMLKACNDLLALARALIPVFPVDMSSWFHQVGMDARNIDRIFISHNPFVYDTENTSKYYLNGHIDWARLFTNVDLIVEDWTKAHDNFMDDYDGSGEDDTTLYVSKHLKGKYNFEAYPSDRKVGELKELLKEVRTHYVLGTVDQSHVDRLHQLGVAFPVFRYENAFPNSDWKIYYRYWDGLFEVVPLTLSRLLGHQFAQYKTIGLISGTFPPADYIQAFWGIQPYHFDVTEKVGKMDFVLAKGASSKFDQREMSYPKWAQLIADKFREAQANGKSLLAAFPSKAVQVEVTKLLQSLLPYNSFWPNGLPNEKAEDVNDMIEELNRCNENKQQKAFLVTQGSRFTEGVEYVDSNGDSMLGIAIVAGIQYPAQDIHIENMQKYVVEQFGYTTGQAFELIQSEAAFQKVRQAAGRTIRSHNDSSVVYLADSRYGQPFWQQRMPTIDTIQI